MVILIREGLKSVLSVVLTMLHDNNCGNKDDVDDENNDDIDFFTIFAFLNSSRILSMLAFESPERFIIILSNSSF